jgi:hypothetical protein
VRAHAFCVLTIILAVHGPRQESSIAVEIGALIEKTNALEGFRAVYRLESEGEEDEECELELVYAAPDGASVNVRGIPGKAMTVCILGSRYYMQVDEGQPWQTFEMEDIRAVGLLEEAFPAEDALDPGVSWSMDLRTKFSISVQLWHYGRPSVLAWLERMRKDDENVVVDGEHLVWKGASFRCAVSRESGFPEQVSVDSDGERKVATLSLLQLEGDVDPPLRPPDGAHSAVDDPDLGRKFEAAALGLLREGAFRRAQRGLESGTLVWSARTRALWEEFLEALHRDMIDLRWRDWIASLDEKTDELVAKLQERLNEQETPERRAQIDEFVSKSEASLSELLDGAAGKYVEGLPPFGSEPREELIEVERAVIERLHEELVSKPVLAYFREQVEEVLGGTR